MKKPRFTDSSNVKASREWLVCSQLCHEHGITSASFYKWRSKFGDMDGDHEGSYERTGKRKCKLAGAYLLQVLRAFNWLNPLKVKGPTISCRSF